MFPVEKAILQTPGANCGGTGLRRRAPVLWSLSYCIISSDGAPPRFLKQYIENQERPE
jgi:REP element-mobilizing transposase RayT